MDTEVKMTGPSSADFEPDQLFDNAIKTQTLGLIYVLAAQIDWKLHTNDRHPLYLATLNEENGEKLSESFVNGLCQVMGEYGHDHLLAQQYTTSTLNSFTPLIEMSARGFVQATKLCLDAGADLGYLDDEGKTAFDAAAENERLNVNALLLGHEARIHTAKAIHEMNHLQSRVFQMS